MASWKHYSLVLRSRGREDHGKQVLSDRRALNILNCVQQMVYLF